MSAIRRGHWTAHLFAYAFVTNSLFGLATVLDTAGIEFFFNYPRITQIALIDSRIDVPVWAASALCLSAFLIGLYGVGVSE